ncbi:hypothetical protein AV530_014767 [Patagioenas fasciata monilis]|uniref:Uncharacterized protein n=1 Tax=Patagioenas fasciata monilis TaxID=372326 RepID=A0A1V4L182_PATFA|nr:hypothetical protein AV530_014767 [Patagioenas fasciata monilis]
MADQRQERQKEAARRQSTAVEVTTASKGTVNGKSKHWTHLSSKEYYRHKIASKDCFCPEKSSTAGEKAR